MERWLFPNTLTGQAVGGVMPDLHVHVKNPRETGEPWSEAATLVPLPCAVRAASRTSRAGA